MANLQSDLSEFVGLLNSRKVDYLVVGGHAVAFHGHPRLTGDIDFFIRPTRENAERVLQVLDDLGFGNLGLGLDDLTTPGSVVQLGRPPNRIDLLTSISGVDFDEAWSAHAAGRLGEHRVLFLGWDALIRNKTASDRDKDRLSCLPSRLGGVANFDGERGELPRTELVKVKRVWPRLCRQRSLRARSRAQFAARMGTRHGSRQHAKLSDPPHQARGHVGLELQQATRSAGRSP